MSRKNYISAFLKRFFILTAALIGLIWLPNEAAGQGNCPPVGLPLYENFNTTDSLPTCWERWENFDEPAMKAHIVSSPVSEGSGALMISCGSTQSTVHRTVLRARKLSQPASGIRMTVKMRANQMGSGERAVIAVGVCSSASENYMTNFEFDTIQVIEITTSNVWTTYTVDFSGYSGTGDRLTFLMSQPMQTGTAHKIFIDEMMVERCMVNNLWVSHRASDELTLHWTSIGQGTANLTVTPLGGGSPLTFNDVSSPYRITGLTPSTTYTLTLTPQCYGETEPGVSQSVSGTTLAGPHLGLMYCDVFGSGTLQLSSGGVGSVLPIIALTDGTVVPIGNLMFTTLMNASSAAGRLEVCVTNYPEEASELTPIDTVIPSSVGSWHRVTKMLNRYTGTARYLVLRAIGSGTITLDDFDIGRCIVTGVGLANYTSTTATIEWDVPEWIGNVRIEPASGTSIIVGPTDGTLVNGKRQYTVSGLEPGGYYSYTVSGACDDACNAGVVSFNTFTQEYPLPYCTDFEMTGTLPTDWVAGKSYNSTPRLDNTQHHSGSRSLRLNAAGTVANGNYSLVILPPFSDTGAVVVSFAAYGSASGSIEVGSVDGGGNASSFVSYGTVTVTSGEWQRSAVNVAAIGTGRRLALRYSHGGSGERSAWVDDLEVSRCGVSGVSAYDERANGATIAWTSGCDSVDIQYRKRGTANTQTVSTATSPLVLNGLDQGSTYDYYIRCTEDGVQGCWIYGGWFVTNTGALTADYCHNGTVSLTSSAALWNLPYLEEADYTGLLVSFEVSGSGTMQVGLMSAEGNASTFTQVGSTISATSTTTRHSVSLSGQEALGHYIALKRVSGNQTVTKLRLSRGSVTSFSVTDVTATTATLTWTTEGVVDSVSVVYQGGGQNGEVIVGGVNTVTLTGLTAGTSYSYNLTAINDISAQSCPADDGTFITLGADVTGGWCENFTSTSTGSLPVGWTAVAGQPTVSWYNSSNRLQMSSTSSSSTMVALPTAVVDFSQTPLILRIEAYCPSSSPEQSTVEAGIMTDRSNASSFTPLASIHPASSTQTYLLNLGSYTGSGRIVALRYVSPSMSRTVYIDNLALAEDMVAEVTTSEVTNHSVKIEWQGATTVQIHWNGNDTTATGHSCTIDGLNANSNYTFTIVANGQWQTLNCQQLTVAAHTLEEPTTAPLCCGMESYYANSGLPYGWHRMPGANYPVSTTGTVYEGSRALQFYTTSGSSTTAVSPMFEETDLAGQYLSFYAYSSNTGSMVQAGTMSDPTDPATFISRGQWTVESSGWRRYEVSLAGTPANHRYVAIRHTTTSGSRYMYVDLVMVQSCPMPTMSIQNPRSTSMEVQWSGGGQVMIEWYRTGYSSGHQTTIADGGSYTITGLTPSTDYTVELWPLCSDSSDFSCHRLTATQVTLPLPTGLPYCQNFNSSSFPSGWYTHNIGGSVNSSTSGYSGRSLQLNLGTEASAFTSVTMPQIDTTGICSDMTEVWIEFRMMYSGTAMLQIGTMQNLNDSSDFTALTTINLANYLSGSWVYQRLSVPASSLVTGILTLRLIHSAGSTASAWIRIDELCVKHCMADNPTIVSTTPTSATFVWNGYSAEGVWVYWNGGSYYATSSPFTITGLNPNQNYNFTFSVQCSCEHTYSLGTGSISHQQPAAPMFGFPVCYDFDNYGTNSFPTEWRRSSTSYPRTASNYAYSGNRSLDFYASSSSPVTMVLQPLPEGCTHAVVGFQVYCTNTDAAAGGRLQVGLVDSTDNLSSFTAVGSVTVEALDTWQRYYVDISNPATRYVALRFAPGSGSYHLYLDDLGFTECAVTGLSAEGAVLTISALGTPTGYILTTINDDDGSTRYDTLSGNPPLSALTFSPDSNYIFTLRALCQSGMSCTPVSATYGYRHAIPYCEEFDGSGLHPYGWSVAVRNSATYPRQQSVGSDSTFYHLQATTSGCIVALPLLPIGRTLGGLHVWLQVKLGSSSDIGNSTVELGSIDDDGNFTLLTTLQNSAVLQSHNVVLPTSSGTRLAIRAVSTSGTRNIYLDHLQITDYARPDALRYTRTSCHLQHVYWDNTADNSHYLVEWGPQGFTPGSGTMVASDSCHVLLSPTAANTTYQIYLYDTASIRFCTPYRFTSLPASTALSYCINSNRTLTTGTMLYLPEIDVAVNTTTLLLTWRTAAAGRLVIGVLTEYQTPSTFTPIDTLYPDEPNTWQRSAIDLYNYADTGRFVALRFEGATGYLQQLTLQNIPQPLFHVLNSHEIEATLPDGYTADYWLRVVVHGASQTSGTAIHVDTTHYIITGLSPYTEYDLYVINNGTGTTCAPSVTLRTHLDINVPYCTNLTSQPTGWNYDGRYRVMPYVLIGSLDSLHFYFTSRGSVTMGLMSALDDTASFLPLATLSTAAYSDQILHLNQYTLPTTHRYVAFRYESSDASITDLVVLKVPKPSYHVLSSSEIEVTTPAGQNPNFWLEVCPLGVAQGNGTVLHIQSSPYVVSGLSMYTQYNFYLLDAAGASTCDQPTLLRTHLDISAPYCDAYSAESDGWYTLGNSRTMPRLIIDTMGDVYVTFVSRGTVLLGVQPTLDDTSAFVPLATVQSSLWEEHVVHLQEYATLVGNRHYISFHGGELQTVYLHICPLPTAELTAYDEVTFTQQESGIDYWIRCSAAGHNDSLVHVSSQTYVLTGLAMNTHYSFSYQCDSATESCIPPVEILTGVRIAAPYCVQLGGIAFGSVNTGETTADGTGALPAGWRTLNGIGGSRYMVLPIINIDSVNLLFARISYRIAQTGSALTIGVMTDATDASTFTAVATLTGTSNDFVQHTMSFAGYTGTGYYIAFQASGNAPSQIYLDTVALQTVPFADYLLTTHNSVLAVPHGMDAFTAQPCYISYIVGNQETVVRADTLPWLITGLYDDAMYSFSLRADSLEASCYPASEVATTHLSQTPLCNLNATLTANAPIWRGPELADADIAGLKMRFYGTTNRNTIDVVVGTLRWRNVDSTFCPIDTITISGGTATIYSVPLSAYTDGGRFLAFRLLPVTGSDNATLTDISLEHCFTPLSGSVRLVRHNKVSIDCSNGETTEWIEYGPAGFAQGSGTTVHVPALPMELTLANGTTYDIYMLCDSGEVTCAAPLTITTLPAPPPLGWCEPFDSQTTGALPTGWRSPTAMTSAQEVKVVSSRSHTTAKSLYMNATIGHSVVAILPDLGLDSLNGLSLSLWLNSSNPSTSRLEVGVIFNTADAESFYPLQSLMVGAANTWERKIVDLRDAPDGAWFVALRCEGSDGLNRLWIDDLHVAECGANSMTVVQVEAQQVTLRWRQTGTPTINVTVIPNEGNSWTVAGSQLTVSSFGSWSQATIGGLEPLTNYRFAFSAVCDQSTGYCTNNYYDTVRVFTPAGGTGCIDPTNLAASYTSCFYGTYNNPYANTGVIDYGYASAQSRHTVHYDLDERDPRTGGQLATIPSGAVASVRLGNWTFNSNNPEAESLVYGLSVDSRDFDLLIMRYAAVLQDPDHAASDQPRFSLELLDSNMHVIDSVCARADFIANWQMGWNFAANSVLWKDWTTVGLDMTPYSGQTVYIRLTTRDCNEGSHYGYAYFTLECMRKSIHTSECGVVTENELTAPSGFNYRWYTSVSDSTISTQQSIIVPSNNLITYLCDNAFVDNPTCYFTMSAFAGVRLPLTLATYEVQLAPCSWDVTFVNQSTISSDGVTPVGTGEGVETARWFFGDGDTANTYNAGHHYDSEGIYNVQLITGIADDRCLDTLDIPLNLMFPPTGLEITGVTERCHNAVPDTLWLRGVISLISASNGFLCADSANIGTHRMYTYRLVMDSASYGAGTHTFTATALDSVGCTVTVSHTVTVHPVYHMLDTRHICSLLLPYSWRDTVFGANTTTGRYTIHRYTTHSCDSIMKVDLNVYDNALYTKRDTMATAICDNQSYYFSDSLLTPNPTVTHNLVANTILYTDSLFSSIGCDSLSTVVLTVHPTYDHHLYDTLCANHSYTWGTPQRAMYQPWDNISYHHANDTLVPASVAATDTSFTDNLQSANQCDSISSLHLHLLPSYILHYSDTICDAEWTVQSGLWPSVTGQWLSHSYHFEDSVFTTTGTYNFQLSTSSYACDSVRTLHLKVYPTHHQHHYDTIYDGDTYTFEDGLYTATGTYSHLLDAVYSCDSLRTLHLQCNRRTYIDSVICQNTLPMTWTHMLDGTPLTTVFNEGGGVRGASWQVIKDSVHLRGAENVDSLVVMTLVIRDTSATYDIVHSCDSFYWFHTPDTLYRTTSSEPYRYLMQTATFDTTGVGALLPGAHLAPYTVHLAPYSIYCDSVRHLTLSVDYTHFYTDYLIECDSLQWRHGEWFYRDTITEVGAVGSHHIIGPVDTLTTVGGCDSVIGLNLAIRNATYEEEADTFCWHSPYTWRGQVVHDDAGVLAEGATEHLHYYLTDTLQTHVFHHPAKPSVATTCDSVMAISLTQLAKPMLQLDDSIMCDQGSYMLLLHTNVPYSRFYSEEFEYRNETGAGFPTEATYRHAVVPSETYTTYTAEVDYRVTTLCPVSSEIKLRPVIIPHADFRYTPEALRYNEMEFEVWDLSSINPRSIHPEDSAVWWRQWRAGGRVLADHSGHLTDRIILEELPEDKRDTVELELSVYNGQCYDTAIHLLPLLRVAVFAPNIFTPGEESNNRFVVVTQGVTEAELRIYNREGLLVYVSDDPAAGWDGRRTDGVMCEQGNYVWKLTYRAIDYPIAVRSEVGTVLLIR